jgi:hypothetical protein
MSPAKLPESTQRNPLAGCGFGVRNGIGAAARRGVVAHRRGRPHSVWARTVEHIAADRTFTGTAVELAGRHMRSNADLGCDDVVLRLLRRRQNDGVKRVDLQRHTPLL